MRLEICNHQDAHFSVGVVYVLWALTCLLVLHIHVNFYSLNCSY